MTKIEAKTIFATGVCSRARGGVLEALTRVLFDTQRERLGLDVGLPGALFVRGPTHCPARFLGRIALPRTRGVGCELGNLERRGERALIGARREPFADALLFRR